MRSFLFPGQGSQYVGMGRQTYINNGIARDICDRADDVLGFQLTGIMFEGPDDELRQTRNAQPAIFLHSYALYQLLDTPQPDMVAGHSLGEYTALAVANALTFDDALRLVQLRGAAMQEAGQQQPGTMAAIIGLDDEKVAAICTEVWQEIGVVQPANFNSPGQLVVSGTPEAVAETMKRAKEAGAKLAKQLNVSGAFHSPLMEPARQRLAQALETTPIRDAEIPVYVNVSAQAITLADDIRAALLAQLTAPVRWTESVQNMGAFGATRFVEVGPGTVLQGLVKRILPGSNVTSIEHQGQIDEFNANTTEA
ncbi:MAG: [acyl-carrier-protein] S-malonyltransferase [Chlorobi bacterium CHB2]|nr:[acyl-carrier-protein] S-malonyltransferase [Chlorobi bacterium CHB2]